MAQVRYPDFCYVLVCVGSVVLLHLKFVCFVFVTVFVVDI